MTNKKPIEIDPNSISDEVEAEVNIGTLEKPEMHNSLNASLLGVAGLRAIEEINRKETFMLFGKDPAKPEAALIPYDDFLVYYDKVLNQPAQMVKSLDELDTDAAIRIPQELLDSLRSCSTDSSVGGPRL